MALMAAAVGAICGLSRQLAHAQLSGTLGAHDPSTLIKDGTTYRYFATGQGIISRRSTNMTFWQSGPTVFSSPPAWTTAAVPGFTGFFWAPDIAYFDGEYHLYYSVSTWGSQVSAIGLATNPTLDPTNPNYAWTDRGPVIQSTNGDPYNTIDPGIFQDDNGRIWMTFGSYWNGIYVTELDPGTGLRLSPGTTPTRLAWKSQIEASYMYKHDGYYYLFVNWGSCCQGTLSTYNIRVGRGTSPTGPFYDKSNLNMVLGGGSLFLGTEGDFIGPGHMGIYKEGELEWFSYHYYDGANNGAPTYNLRRLYWDANGWPSATPINPNWTGSTNSNWSLAGNWSNSVLPNGPGHTANFGSISSGRYAVAVDGGAKTVGAINFDSVSTYTIGSTGGNSIILDAVGANASINVINGSHIIAAPVVLNDDLDLAVSSSANMLTMSGALTATGRTINKSGAGTVQFEFVRAAALNVNAGKVKISAKASPNDPGGTSVVNFLSIDFTAQLDLTNNSMIIDYAGSSPIETIRQKLYTGRMGGAWNGNGIITSLGSAALGLGFAEASALGVSSFGGQPVDSTAVLIKFTYSGDADLDGDVDNADFGTFFSHFQQTGQTWFTGDFDYDGDVDNSDFGLFFATFNSPPLPSATAGLPAPEPTMLAAVGLAVVLLRRAARP